MFGSSNSNNNNNNNKQQKKTIKLLMIIIPFDRNRKKTAAITPTTFAPKLTSQKSHPIPWRYLPLITININLSIRLIKLPT